MNEDMMTEAERASKLAEPATEDTATRGKGVFYVHTLGCQMNVHDSERIAGVLEADGYVPPPKNNTSIMTWTSSS